MLEWQAPLTQQQGEKQKTAPASLKNVLSRVWPDALDDMLCENINFRKEKCCRMVVYGVYVHVLQNGKINRLRSAWPEV